MDVSTSNQLSERATPPSDRTLRLVPESGDRAREGSDLGDPWGIPGDRVVRPLGRMDWSEEFATLGNLES
jgi:hypothetical protein